MLQQSRERLAAIPEQKLALQVEHQRAYAAAFVDLIVHEEWEKILQNPKAKPMFADMPANRFALQKQFVETNLFPKLYDDVVPVYEDALAQAQQIEVEPMQSDRLTRDLIWVYDLKGHIYDQISEDIAADFVEKEKRCEAFFESGEVSALGNDYMGLYDLLSTFAYDYLSAYATEAVDYHRETLTYAEDQGIQSDYLDSLQIEQMDHLYRLALRYQFLLQSLKEKEKKYQTLADQGDPDAGYEDMYYAYEDLSMALVDNASMLYELNLELAEEYGGEIGARYRKESEDGLCQVDPERCPEPEGELQTMEIITDETWLVSNVEEEGWTALDFSDAHWVPASPGAMLEENTIPNLEDLVGSDIWDAAGSDSVFFRRRFDLQEAPEKATIVVGAYDEYALYVNGLWIEEGAQEGALRDLIALGVSLSKGENLIAVKARNFGGAAADTTEYVPEVEEYVPEADTTGYVPEVEEYVPEADTTGYVPEADTTGYVPEADTTEYVPEADTTGYVPEADTTGYVPEADTTGYVPEADTTEYVSEAYTTRLLSVGYVSEADTTGYGLLCRLTVEMFIPAEEEVAPTEVPEYLAATESPLSPADSLFMATLKPSERETFLSYKMAEHNAQIETAIVQAGIDSLKRALRQVNAEIRRIETQLDTWNWIMERKEE